MEEITHVEVLIFNSREDSRRFFSEGEDTTAVRRLLGASAANEHIYKSIERTLKKGQIMVIRPIIKEYKEWK